MTTPIGANSLVASGAASGFWRITVGIRANQTVQSAYSAQQLGVNCAVSYGTEAEKRARFCLGLVFKRKRIEQLHFKLRRPISDP